MILRIEPPHRVGPLEIGMPIELAQQALKDILGFKHPRPGERTNPFFGHYESGLSVSVGPDHAGRLLAVEIYGPGHDAKVLFGSISLFSLTADDVIRQLSAVTTVHIEEDGHGAIAPDLLLALWRGVVPDGPDDEDGRHWQSVLMAKPGYYDTPTTSGR
jgi:hypothetical protein